MPTERWALVPVEATPEMRKEGKEAMSKYGSRVSTFMDADVCYAAMLNKNPGAALLAEVLAARDAYIERMPERISEYEYNLLAALDKLGPAAEGET